MPADYKADKDWQSLTNCAGRLEAVDPAAAAELKAKAKAEQANSLAVDRVKGAINDGSLPKAARELGKIDDDSVYKAEVKAEYEAALQKVIDDFKGRAQASNRAKRCADVDKLITQAAAQGQAVVDVVRPFKCAVEVAVTPPVDHSQDHKNNPPGTGSAAVAVPQPAGDPQALAEQGAARASGSTRTRQALGDVREVTDDARMTRASIRRRTWRLAARGTRRAPSTTSTCCRRRARPRSSRSACAAASTRGSSRSRCRNLRGGFANERACAYACVRKCPQLFDRLIPCVV